MRLPALLAIGIVLVAASGCGGETTTIIKSTSTPEAATPCTLEVSGGPGEIALGDSGFSCADARALFADYQNAAAAEEAVGSGGFAEVDGWTCNTYPLASYPTLAKCQSDGKTFTVLGTAPAAHAGGGTEPDSVPPSQPHDATVKAVTFQTPSGNIGCSISDEFVNCAVLEADWVPEGEQCAPDEARSISMSSGSPTIRCGAELPIDDTLPGPVLPYGESISRGGNLCASNESELVCSNGGIGFAVSKEYFEPQLDP